MFLQIALTVAYINNYYFEWKRIETLIRSEFIVNGYNDSIYPIFLIPDLTLAVDIFLIELNIIISC